MANIRLIKGRIKSAKNISQITKAMELVAASKMKKATMRALSGKLYSQKIYDMVMELSGQVDTNSHPLLRKPDSLDRRLIILITANKGLCGGLNTNVLRFLIHEKIGEGHDFITLGKKGIAFVTFLKGTLKADFSESYPFANIVPAVTELLVKEFVTGQYSAVDLVFNEFISALRQVPTRKTVLPLEFGSPQRSTAYREDSLVIEPSARAVFERLLPHYIENQVRDSVLQAEASEHSARMVAMRNATDNALSLMDELTLLYNKARQEKITYEISDMVTARLAVEH